jgi:hypothetical protein
LEILKDRGEAERTGGGKKNDPYLYCLFDRQNSLLSECHSRGKETNLNGRERPMVEEALKIFGGNIARL